MKVSFLLIIIIFLTISRVSGQSGQTEEPFVYSDEGRRDPFIPLIDRSGRYLSGGEELYSSDELNLSGILWDPQGRSSCLINNQMVKVGGYIYGFMVKDIAKDSVTVSKQGKVYILRLSTEGEQ